MELTGKIHTFGQRWYFSFDLVLKKKYAPPKVQSSEDVYFKSWDGGQKVSRWDKLLVGDELMLRREMTISEHGGLSFVDGAGLRIKCLSGRLWVTEEGNPIDAALLPREEMSVANSGKVLITALRSASVILHYSYCVTKEVSH